MKGITSRVKNCGLGKDLGTQKDLVPRKANAFGFGGQTPPSLEAKRPHQKKKQNPTQRPTPKEKTPSPGA